MNVLVKTIGGGIFSTFVLAIQSVLENIPDINSINSIYIEFDKERNLHTPHNFHLNSNVYDFVLENQNTVFDKIINAEVSLNHIYRDLNDLLNTNLLSNLNTIVSKIKIKKNITDKINNIIDNNTLGVHVRMTDMLTVHPEYVVNKRSAENYIYNIKTIFSENPKLNKLFVASDNIPVLLELKKEFPSLICNEVGNRSLYSDDSCNNYVHYQYKQMNNENFWIDSFVEMLSLSKCGALLYSTSNLSHSSLFFSKTINKIYKV